MNFLKLTPLVISVLIATGCTMAPVYERPESPVAPTFPQGAAYEDLAFSTAPLPTWDTFFTNAKLREVINTALTNNRDLRIAILNVEKARAAYGIQRASLMPNAGADFSPTGSHTPDTMAPTGHGYTSHTYQATLASTSWEIDLFGRVRSLTEAALQNYLATEEAQYGTQNSLIAEVANAWINVGAQKELLRLQEITLKSQQNSFKLISDSYRLGARSLLDVEQARTTVETARAAVVQYQRSLAQARNNLELLVGTKVPESLEPEKLEDPSTYGAIAPKGLSSEVLLNRPDIRAAENSLKAANANIGAARANFFPRITLTAGVGTGSQHLNDLFSGGSGLWSFAPGITLPIFTGGANISQLRQAEAEQKAKVAQYEKTIQSAFAEVANTLAAEGTMTRQCSALRALVDATQRAYNLSYNRYKNGLDGFLTVLESQRQMVAAQTNYIVAEQNRLSSNVTLYKVLGGGSIKLASVEPAVSQTLASTHGTVVTEKVE
ncbi:efflux transporter outer membrane subunit [Turicimonas muris]|uniref:Multidrug transporter n=1 Tax=Turicimonas muris TaxID=1796652 RepID=A0A227KE50_9BURK|nr:efflux transporter outer membrane subunit [Turicimonas muris]ANU66411.1 multidrug transporter [Burkholderiales bacterium YL45]OXE45991.1 multidrug transporter [Turicimonas muris]QQQ97557.1 efflux transporter outer membrane subunit [Turicimonas muris]